MVTDHMVCLNPVFFHQHFHQLGCRFHGGVLKIPVLVGGIQMRGVPLPHAHLDSQGIGVATFRMYIRAGAAVPGNVFILHALPHGAVKIHIVVGRRSPVSSSVVLAVGFCPSQGSHIMNHNVFDAGSAPGRIVIAGNHPVNFHKSFLLSLFGRMATKVSPKGGPPAQPDGHGRFPDDRKAVLQDFSGFAGIRAPFFPAPDSPLLYYILFFTCLPSRT